MMKHKSNGRIMMEDDSKFHYQISDLERKIGSTQFNLDQLNVGKNAFINMLAQSLEEPVEVAAE